MFFSTLATAFGPGELEWKSTPRPLDIHTPYIHAYIQTDICTRFCRELAMDVFNFWPLFKITGSSVCSKFIVSHVRSFQNVMNSKVGRNPSLARSMKTHLSHPKMLDFICF